MLSLARQTEHGIFRAGLIASIALLLGLVFWPATIVSVALIALVVLRYGSQYALSVMVVGAVAIALPAGLLLGGGFSSVLFPIVSWVPAALMAGLLRQTQSLSLVLALTALAVLLVFFAVWLLLPELPMVWEGLLTQIFADLQQSGVNMVFADVERLVAVLVPSMTASIIAMLMLSALLALLQARSWQSALSAPGAYQREWASLRLGQIGTLALVLISLLLCLSGSQSVQSAALIPLLVILLAGLAVLHGLALERANGRRWLRVLYLMLVGSALISPTIFVQIAALIVLVAVLDPWLDLRARLAGG